MFNLDSSVTSCHPPAPADREQVRCGLERWRAACAGLADPHVQDLAVLLEEEPAARRLLEAVFGNSPFLTLMAELEAVFLLDLLRDGPDAATRRIMSDLEEAQAPGSAGVNPGAATCAGASGGWRWPPRSPTSPTCGRSSR